MLTGVVVVMAAAAALKRWGPSIRANMRVLACGCH
jgi:hypothetical protein